MKRIWLEQFQEKCEAVFRPELRENKEIEHLRASEKNGNALGKSSLYHLAFVSHLELGFPGSTTVQRREAIATRQDTRWCDKGPPAKAYQ
ncbi:hypothetical protein [Rhizobium binxianense]|uniref:hypothetical protein n=1 Tax=Rhizobium binxianense TaxID=3024242 RepID=UPI002361F0C5|nr:hypothetical protein [Rhizobium sp. MJ37]MDC9835942.1 hypothetical protein [Rhizobium sp. MJ37]